MKLLPEKYYAAIASRVKYCPKTGKFTWLYRDNPAPANWNSIYAGKECGHMSKNGYVYLTVSLDGQYKHILAHRVAWYIMFGEVPKHQIDHINGNRTDNRIVNLREATPGQNSRNTKLSVRNSSGFSGVHWYKSRRKWQTYTDYQGKRFFLGYYDNKDEAISAVEAFKNERDFSERHGK